ncbi:WbqC family protein [Psychrobacter sp. ANT_H56B]|uniref:WbqC family protein n=1 Tax=Psychrobacter sp. ANT_H56B TaxID=2597353 RepID=UPI0011F1552A|nr:WbqC family protein [Psychrobacter sp. ANT_H56B]KAA0924181.1 WbqC family protein [Psychrobacter sp. ANT_H56B]
MKLAIMQPYFMPYIGYFQLINLVDKFVFYDDVTFIKQGWINRNQILINDQAKLFSVPLSNASSHTLIKDVLISDIRYEKWKKSFLTTIMFNYKKAKNYDIVEALIESILLTPPKTISELAIKSVIEISNYLDLDTEFDVSSKNYSNAHLSGQCRVLDICQKENANTYINPIGGIQLYSKDMFSERKIELMFLSAHKTIYKQFSSEFIPFLSIIDVLMFNDKKQVLEMLNDFELV